MHLSPQGNESLMAGSSQRKAHTDPGAQRARHNKKERAKAQLHAAALRGMHSHLCTTVPEEESSTSVSTPSQPPSLPLPVLSSPHHMVPSFPPQRSISLQQFGPVGHNQYNIIQDENFPQHRSQTPSTTFPEHYSLGAARTSSAGTPTRSKRSPSYSRPSSKLSCEEDYQWQLSHLRRGSATPRASPAPERWSASLNPDPDSMTEPPSFTHSEYEQEQDEDPLNITPENCSASCCNRSLRSPGLYHKYGPRGAEARSAYSNPFPLGHYSGNCPYTEYPTHSTCSLPTSTLHSRHHSQGDFHYGEQPNRMSTRYHNKQQG